MKILVVRPAYDSVTRQNAYWLLKLAESLASKYKVMDLFTPQASTIDRALAEFKPDVFLAEGHGLPDYYLIGRETIYLSSENATKLSGKYVFLFSCLTGKSLGPALVSSGTKGFIGFYKPLTILVYEENPDLPEVAVLYIIWNKTIWAALEHGLSTAYAVAMTEFNKWINYYKKKDDPLAVEVISVLTKDRDGFRVVPYVPGEPVPIEAIYPPLIGMAGAGLLLGSLIVLHRGKHF